MIRMVSAFACSLFALVAVGAQDAADMQSDLQRKVDHIFRRYAKADAPGAVVLVGRGADVVLQRAYGAADLERKVPLSAESVFDLGSTSKQFTAACLLLLVHEKKVDLADLAKKHVPELPSCCDAVTVRHLMLHTSGLPDYIDLLSAAGAQMEDRTSADEAMEQLTKVTQLQFAAGTKWEYSNSNYFLLSEIVERVGKRPLAEFARERLFEPLGLQHTHVHDDCTVLVPNRALSYSRVLRGRWRWSFSNWEQTGDGAVMTTVGDLFRWARNYTSGVVGGPELLAAMATPGTLDDGTAIEYGAGLMFTEEGGRRVVMHGGAWASYRAELLRVPSEDLVVICLCNRDDMNPTELCLRVARAARQTVTGK